MHDREYEEEMERVQTFLNRCAQPIHVFKDADKSHFRNRIRPNLEAAGFNDELICEVWRVRKSRSFDFDFLNNQGRKPRPFDLERFLQGDK